MEIDGLSLNRLKKLNSQLKELDKFYNETLNFLKEQGLSFGCDWFSNWFLNSNDWYETEVAPDNPEEYHKLVNSSDLSRKRPYIKNPFFIIPQLKPKWKEFLLVTNPVSEIIASNINNDLNPTYIYKDWSFKLEKRAKITIIENIDENESSIEILVLGIGQNTDIDFIDSHTTLPLKERNEILDLIANISCLTSVAEINWRLIGDTIQNISLKEITNKTYNQYCFFKEFINHPRVKRYINLIGDKIHFKSRFLIV